MKIFFRKRSCFTKKCKAYKKLFKKHLKAYEAEQFTHIAEPSLPEIQNELAKVYGWSSFAEMSQGSKNPLIYARECNQRPFVFIDELGKEDIERVRYKEVKFILTSLRSSGTLESEFLEDAIVKDADALRILSRPRESFRDRLEAKGGVEPQDLMRGIGFKGRISDFLSDSIELTSPLLLKETGSIWIASSVEAPTLINALAPFTDTNDGFNIVNLGKGDTVGRKAISGKMLATMILRLLERHRHGGSDIWYHRAANLLNPLGEIWEALGREVKLGDLTRLDLWIESANRHKIPSVMTALSSIPFVKSNGGRLEISCDRAYEMWGYVVMMFSSLLHDLDKVTNKSRKPLRIEGNGKHNLFVYSGDNKGQYELLLYSLLEKVNNAYRANGDQMRIPYPIYIEPVLGGGEQLLEILFKSRRIGLAPTCFIGDPFPQESKLIANLLHYFD